MLEARNLTKRFHIGEREISVLDQINFAVAPGEFVAINGKSGSGKTTLLTLLSGLDTPTSGRIFVQEKDITQWSEDRLAPLRNRTFGFVFQSFHLVPSLTAMENVIFPAELCGDPEAENKGKKLLGHVGLLQRSDNYPSQLSGGEKQRIAICRAIINDPRIIFADEPTGNLDSVNGELVLELLLKLHRTRETTLLMVTHNQKIAEMADRMVTLEDGHIIADSR